MEVVRIPVVAARPGAAWWQQHGHRAGCTGAGYTRCYGSTGVLSSWKLAQIPWWTAASALHSNLHISGFFFAVFSPSHSEGVRKQYIPQGLNTLWEKWENKMRSMAWCSAPTRPQGGGTEGHFWPVFCKPKCFLELFATSLWLRGLFAYRNTPEQTTPGTNGVCVAAAPTLPSVLRPSSGPNHILLYCQIPVLPPCGTNNLLKETQSPEGHSGSTHHESAHTAGTCSSVGPQQLPPMVPLASANTKPPPSWAHELSHPAPRGWTAEPLAASCCKQAASSCLFSAQHLLEQLDKNVNPKEERASSLSWMGIGHPNTRRALKISFLRQKCFWLCFCFH